MSNNEEDVEEDEHSIENPPFPAEPTESFQRVKFMVDNETIRENTGYGIPIPEEQEYVDLVSVNHNEQGVDVDSVDNYLVEEVTYGYLDITYEEDGESVKSETPFVTIHIELQEVDTEEDGENE